MRRLISLAGVLALLASTACRDAVVPTEPAGPDLSASARADRQSYIVVFRRGTADVPGLAARLAADHGGQINHVYRHALQGFAARFPAQALAGLRRNPNVDFIEADQVFTVISTQSNATWGLDRIDQRDLPLSTTYGYDVDGSGVWVYIIDTGIRTTHNEFEGRASSGFTSITDGRGTDDCHGHGTHVSGTVGGKEYGVAKKVSLIAVRVLDCSGSGTTAGVIAGVDWVTGNHLTPAVANMSLGGGASTALDAAVSNSVTAGVTYAIAAGNSNANACNYSPARAATAITVGATTSSDARASYSNYGTCLDIFGPGSSITSAWNTSNTATNTISGTSMATPHVAGVAALVLQSNPTFTPAAVAQALTSNASTGKVGSPGTGSPNLLLYSAFNGSGGGSPPPPSSIALSVSTSKSKGKNYAHLSWTGAGGSVDVFRNNSKVTTVGGTSYTDALGRGSGSRTYHVCNAGTSTCSSPVTVSY